MVLRSIIVGCLFAVLVPLEATPACAGKDWVDVRALSGVAVDLRYSTTNNFTAKVVYASQDCYAHKIAAEKLSRSAGALQKTHPGWKILVFDALRPRSAQWALWNVVKGTPQQGYVGDPKKGSIHNYGLAIDLSLQDDQGHEIDMGTPYDSFQPLAQPRYEAKYLKNGELTAGQHANRELLRKVMAAGGFIGISNEWWHFEALPRDDVRKNFPVCE
jgi:D-alanyl-D-alanine dipeptidase